MELESKIKSAEPSSGMKKSWVIASAEIKMEESFTSTTPKTIKRGLEEELPMKTPTEKKIKLKAVASFKKVVIPKISAAKKKEKGDKNLNPIQLQQQQQMMP